MPFRDAAPDGAPCWVDLSTSDPDRARVFYGELFDWTSASAGLGYGGYVNFFRRGVPVAGCMRNPDANVLPDVWSVYLASGDAAATVDAAAANGGEVLVPAMRVMTLGTMAVVADPGRASIGVWEPAEHSGFGVIAESGAPAWFELHTRRYDATVRFYAEVFGWDTYVASDTPELRYTTLGQGHGQVAGIIDASGLLPLGVPAHWSVYFGVVDTDAALSEVVSLGGSVVGAAEDTPCGRLAVATDPTGARFKLVGA
jgi:predicted enzyme related to lactoylglutathione lyase